VYIQDKNVDSQNKNLSHEQETFILNSQNKCSTDILNIQNKIKCSTESNSESDFKYKNACNTPHLHHTRKIKNRKNERRTLVYYEARHRRISSIRGFSTNPSKSISICTDLVFLDL